MKINEITYGSGIQSLAPYLKIDFETIIGVVDNLEVYKQSLGNGTAFFLVEPNQKNILSYVATDNKSTDNFLHLKLIENVYGIKGSLSALMYFLTKNQGLKFMITAQEPLTRTGLSWVNSVLLSNRQLFKFTDQTGNIPNINNISDEWEKSRINPEYKGKIEIFIESNILDSIHKIFESEKGLLIPLYRIYKDMDLE